MQSVSAATAFEDDLDFPESRPDWWRYPEQESSPISRPTDSPSGVTITPTITSQLVRRSSRPFEEEVWDPPVAAATALPSVEQATHLLLTITQAAERLQVGRCTMQALVLDGSVRSFKIGRLRRIPPEALDEFISRTSES